MFLSSHLKAIYLLPWKCVLKIHHVSTKKAFSLVISNVLSFSKCLLFFPFWDEKNSQHSWPTFVPLSSFSFVTSFTKSFSQHLVDMTKTITLYFTKFLYFLLIYFHNKPHEVSLENINIPPFTYTETEPWKELTSLLWQDTEQPTVTSKALCDRLDVPFQPHLTHPLWGTLLTITFLSHLVPNYLQVRILSLGLQMKKLRQGEII